MSLKQLCIKCPQCHACAPAGFQLEYPDQLKGFFYKCNKCYAIFPHEPKNYSLATIDPFADKLSIEELFGYPIEKGRVLIDRGFYHFNFREVILPLGTYLLSNQAVISYGKMMAKTRATYTSKEIKNSRLYDLVNSFIKECYYALYKKYSREYLSWYDRISTLIEGGTDNIADLCFSRPDLNMDSLIYCIHYAEKFAKELQEAGVFKNPPHASNKDLQINELIFITCKVFDYIDRSKIDEFFKTRRAFESHLDTVIANEYCKYENYIYNELAYNSLVCPLHNISLDSDISLNDNVFFREQIEFGFHNRIDADMESRISIDYYPASLLVIIDKEDSSSDCIQRHQKQLINVIIALKLLKDESIGLSEIYYAYAFPNRPWASVEAPKDMHYKDLNAENIPRLSSEDGAKLSEIIRFLDYYTTNAVKYSNIDIFLEDIKNGLRDWTNLYRIFEVIQRDVGDVEQFGITNSEKNRFKQTANSQEALGSEARHGIPKVPPPKVPMSYEDAKSFIRNLVLNWIELKLKFI